MVSIGRCKERIVRRERSCTEWACCCLLHISVELRIESAASPRHVLVHLGVQLLLRNFGPLDRTGTSARSAPESSASRAASKAAPEARAASDSASALRGPLAVLCAIAAVTADVASNSAATTAAAYEATSSTWSPASARNELPPERHPVVKATLGSSASKEPAASTSSAQSTEWEHRSAKSVRYRRSEARVPARILLGTLKPSERTPVLEVTSDCTATAIRHRS